VPAKGQAEQYDSDFPQKQSYSINTEKGTHLEKEKTPERSLPARLEKRLPLWDLPGQIQSFGGVRSAANLRAAIQRMQVSSWSSVLF
jgi:hypothetical protein